MARGHESGRCIPGWLPRAISTSLPCLSWSVFELGNVMVIPLPLECHSRCSKEIPASSDRRRPPANPTRSPGSIARVFEGRRSLDHTSGSGCAPRLCASFHPEESCTHKAGRDKSGQMFSSRNFFASSAFRAPARCLASPKRTGKRSSRAFGLVDLPGSRRCSVCIVITTTMKARDARRETQHQQ